MKKKTKSTPLAVVQSPAAYYRDRVNTSYADVNAKTGEWFRSVISFGALIDEVAAFLGAKNGGKHEGGSLENWLSKNCPEVNYKTAMGYKAMAVKCAKMLGGGTQAIAALQGRDTVSAPGGGEAVDVDAEILEKRDQLFEAADSRRKLEQMYLDFMSRKPGRPKGTTANKKVSAATLSPEEDARALWSRLIAPAQTYGIEPAASLLTADDAEAALEILTGLCDILKRRLGR